MLAANNLVPPMQNIAAGVSRYKVVASFGLLGTTAVTVRAKSARRTRNLRLLRVDQELQLVPTLTQTVGSIEVCPSPCSNRAMASISFILVASSGW